MFKTVLTDPANGLTSKNNANFKSPAFMLDIFLGIVGFIYIIIAFCAFEIYSYGWEKFKRDWGY